MDDSTAITWSRLAANSAHLALGTSCGPDRAATAAAVTISGMLVMWLELSVTTALATTSGAAIRPTRQPGMPEVLDSESTNTVRARSEGSNWTKLLYGMPSNSMRL